MYDINNVIISRITLQYSFYISKLYYLKYIQHLIYTIHFMLYILDYYIIKLYTLYHKYLIIYNKIITP